MAGIGKTYVGLLNAAIFILLEVAALAMLHSSSSLQNIWINRFSHRILAATWGSSERVRDYFSLEDRNEQLARENFELLAQVQRFKAMENEFQAMKQIDSSGFTTLFEYIPATITKIGRNTQHNYIIINKGSDDGVEEQSAIVTSHGVVGMVFAVDKRYSYGLTLMNDKITVSARVGKSGVVAPLSWDGVHTDGAVLSNVPLHMEVAPGDTVTTSGFSMIYPPDIPLGVTTGSRLVDGSTNVIDVKLFEDFASLKYVVIAKSPVSRTIQNLEELQ